MSNRILPANSINPNATIAPGLVVAINNNPQLIVSGVQTNVIGAVFTSTWGPVNSATAFSAPAGYLNEFGDTLTNKYDGGTFVSAASLQGNNATFIGVRVTDGTDAAATGTLVDSLAMPVVGVILTAFYTGTTGNKIKAIISNGPTTGTYNLTLSLPGGFTETYSNIGGSGATFWQNLVNAVNQGLGLQGPSRLAVATLAKGIGAIAVTAPGSGYTAVPSVAITGGGGSGAAAIAVLGFAINSISVDVAGSYATLPTLSATVGTGATLSPVMKAVSATFAAAGSGYAANDVLTLTGGTSTTSTQVTVDTVDGSGHILTAHISRVGSYTVLPTGPVAVTGGTGTGATFTMLWGLLSITVGAGGSNYDSTSVLSITGGGGMGGGAGTLTLASSGGVKAVTITAGGMNYATVPTVVFTGGSGTGAAATASIGSVNTPALTGVTLTGATNGISGVTGPSLLGQDISPGTGLYALRGSGANIGALVDCDDPTTYSDQLAFGQTEGVYMQLVDAPGHTIAQMVAAKNSAGIADISFKFCGGDWIYFLDTANGGIVRIISPQSYFAGVLANLAPQESSLNKPMNGILNTQKTFAKQIYSNADIQTLMINGIDIISKPSPRGQVFTAQTGKNGSINPVDNNDPIPRMTYYLAQSLDAAAGLGTVIGELQTPDTRAAALSAIVAFLQNLKTANQIKNFKVVLDDSNNPENRVELGFMAAQVRVQLYSVVIVFLIDLAVGTATLQ